ncbi:hypothetical protein GUITHDRAFT_109163 [Guillardia theta CCMP2712]|uniref:Uncharacterized protein n=1 Tax=Guillardia theta (strain CCMP2712) TaxID=905079 RepID=L1JAI8_GUITC|nr:hypothetical protein GUITHDRAFT_109163 [Guillardia theta CCMP2712]EKX45119.1 hypothetical protein GUITHDRAFT_109163 [Guillardia theta CCMP2712]|eukprot:XP_005832099.1 hypothetical protein GUITHDRAFT_109163 [Guillardia theta CCMP2712]
MLLQMPPTDLTNERQLIRELEILKELCTTPPTVSFLLLLVDRAVTLTSQQNRRSEARRSSVKPFTADASKNEKQLALKKRPSTSECNSEGWRQHSNTYESLREDGRSSERVDITVALRLNKTTHFRDMNIFALQSTLADELCQAEGIARSRIAFYDLDTRKIQAMRDVCMSDTNDGRMMEIFRRMKQSILALPFFHRQGKFPHSWPGMTCPVFKVRSKTGPILDMPLASNILDCQVVTSSTDSYKSYTSSPRQQQQGSARESSTGQQIFSCHPTKLTFEVRCFELPAAVLISPQIPPPRPKTQGGLLYSTTEFAEMQNAIVRAKQRLAFAERKAYTAAEMAKKMAISIRHQSNHVL